MLLEFTGCANLRGALGRERSARARSNPSDKKLLFMPGLYITLLYLYSGFRVLLNVFSDGQRRWSHLTYLTNDNSEKITQLLFSVGNRIYYSVNSLYMVDFRYELYINAVTQNGYHNTENSRLVRNYFLYYYLIIKICWYKTILKKTGATLCQ